MEQEVIVIINDILTVHIIIVGKINWTEDEAARMAIGMFLPIVG